MRILVTGAEGFIGGYLTKYLEDMGYEVVKHSREKGDIAVSGTMAQFENIEHVCHLAGKTFVPESFQKSFEFFETNIMGTVNVLEFCRKNNCGLTFLSTYVYGEPQYLPVDEKHQTVALTPYHESKLLGEHLCEYYSSNFQVKITTLRLFNVYGVGQSENFIVPLIFKQISEEERNNIEVKDLKPKRDYIYVKDVVGAIEKSFVAPNIYNVYNVGSGQSYSVETIIQQICKATQSNKKYVATNQVRGSEVSDCVANISKINHELNFNIAYSLEQGIADMLK